MDFDIEYRIASKTGYRWCHDYARVTRREDGSASRMDGITFDIQDIFDGREAQKTLTATSARLFALEDTFEALYDVELESGHYASFGRDEFYQKNISDKLVSQSEFFDDLRTNVERVVYEEDREGVYNVQTRESIKKGLAENDHIDHYYRVLTEYGTMWLKMRIVYKDAERKNVIVGVFNAEEEMAIKEKEKRAREELAQTNARLFALEDNFESLYDVELESGHYDVFVKGDFFRNNVLSKLSVPKDYFEELRGNIDAVIFSEDKEGLYNTLTRESIKKELSENDHFDYYYRLNTENGPAWFKMRIVYKDAERKNVIVGVFNAEKDVEARQLAEQKAKLEESLTFTNFFLDTYVSAYYVDFETLSCQVYKRTSQLESDYPIITNYFDSINEYISRDVHPDDRAMMAELVRPENMKAELRKRNEYSHIFRDISGDMEKTYRMQIIRGAGENNAAFGFIDISDEVNEQAERLKEADAARKLVESVAASYDVAYAINMANDSYKLLKNDGDILKGGDQFRNYSESKEALLSVIHESDRERMRHELDYGTIRRKIKETKSYNIEYRVRIGGSTSWHEMNITKIDEDQVALGFSDKDLELTQRHLEEKRYGEYFALFTVDIDTESLKIVKNEEHYNVVPVGESVPYTEYIRGLAMKLDGEPRDFYMMISDIDYVKRDLAVDDKRTYTYRSTHIEGNKWVDVTSFVILRHDDGTPAMFTMGFSIVDALATERQELQEKLQEALEMAKSANRAKTDFLFNMSHDIRTPMNAITGFTNMAVKHIDDREKVLDCLDKTQKAGSMLLSLINSVLEVSRIESGKVTIERQPGDVYYSFSNIDQTMRELAETKDISLSFEFGDIRDRYVFADFSRCMRIFVNVISNAIKYTPDGGTVKVRCEQIGRTENGAGKYQYTVSDNGIGMSEEFQKHIFEQFTREKTATVSGIQGTGLGMSVVKSFVDLMGGTIDVYSRVGEGSTFTIVLPLELQNEETYTDPKTGEVVSASNEEPKTGKADFRGKNILLVEDNELNREIAIEILDEEGLLVEDADDGTTAVDILREKGPDYFDFILMDIQMPKMNGYEATRAIREMYPDTHIPIIALSANAFSEDKAASLAAGMDDHVAKPIDIRELFGTMEKFL